MELESKTLTDGQLAGLKKLREPFNKKHISKLPKPTKKQTESLAQNFSNGIRCKVCGGWHHKDVVHLDYVGHAALTSRLLEADPQWNWEPFAVDDIGSPKLDSDGGMWGYLTVCGMTRRGYGDAGKKRGPDATKERIGDFLRNAAMRFGAAIDLWSKADLTNIDGSTEEEEREEIPPTKQETKSGVSPKEIAALEQWIDVIDSFTKKTLDEWLAYDEQYILPATLGFSKTSQDRLTIARRETQTYLQEQGDKGL